LIGCPEIKERAGKIYVYLRKIFVDAYFVPFLKLAAELDGTHRNMRLGTPDSLTNSLQVTESTESLVGFHHLHIVHLVNN
jgi:hypothetical protein